MNRYLRTLIYLTLLCLVGCASQPRISAPTRSEPRAQTPPPIKASISPTLQRLVDEAALLEPLAQSALTRRFLDATNALPPVAPRTAYINEMTREYFSPAARESLPDARRTALSPVQLDEFRYYYTKYGSPLAYIRALDFAVDKNFTDVAGKRILDFGYGSIGMYAC